MSNCSIGALNWIYEGGPQWSKGDWQIGPEALENWDTKEYTRSETAAAADTQLGIEFDIARPVDTVFLGYHNGTDSGKFRLLAGPAPIVEDFSTYTSGQIPAGFDYSCDAIRSYWDANGILRYVGPNIPRYGYHPTTGEFLGYLQEGQSTYLPVYSEDLTSWTSVGATVAANAETAPDGNATADRIVETTASSIHGRTIGVTWPAFNNHRVSWFAKNASLSWQCLYINDAASEKWVFFNASTGTVGHKTTGVTTSVENLANGWYRVTAQFLAASNASTGSIGFFTARADGGDATPKYAGSTGNRIIVWGVTVETGALANTPVPGSYVKTEVSTVVRPVESGFTLASGLSSFTANGEVSMAIGFTPAYRLNSVTAPTTLEFSDGTVNNRYGIFFSFSEYSAAYMRNGGFNQVAASTGILSFDSENVVVFTLAENSAAACQNGGSVVTDSSLSVPAVSQLKIGGSGGPYYISRFAICAGRMPNADVQETANDFAQFDELVPAAVPWTDLVPTTNTPDSNGRTYFGRNSSGKMPENERDPRGVCRIAFLDEEVVSRNFTLQIRDTANPDGYFQFSILWLGKSERPELGVEPGFSMINVSENRRKRSLGGTFYGRRMWQRKRFSGALRNQREEFALPFYQELARMVDVDRPILFSLYPGTAGNNEDRFTILGVLEEPTPIENSQYIYWGWPFSIVQL